MHDTAACPKARRKTALRTIIGRHTSYSRLRIPLVTALKAIVILRLACPP